MFDTDVVHCFGFFERDVPYRYFVLQFCFVGCTCRQILKSSRGLVFNVCDIHEIAFEFQSLEAQLYQPNGDMKYFQQPLKGAVVRTDGKSVFSSV